MAVVLAGDSRTLFATGETANRGKDSPEIVLHKHVVPRQLPRVLQQLYQVQRLFPDLPPRSVVRIVQVVWLAGPWRGVVLVARVWCEADIRRALLSPSGTCEARVIGLCMHANLPAVLTQSQAAGWVGDVSIECEVQDLCLDTHAVDLHDAADDCHGSPDPD